MTTPRVWYSITHNARNCWCVEVILLITQENSRSCEIMLANEILTLLCLYLRLRKWWKTKDEGKQRKERIGLTWVVTQNWSMLLTLKGPGFLDPSHSREGGGFCPPKISETDWRNIKCVVLVDIYYPPESIGTKTSTNIPCMTPQWHHKWRHVKNRKVTKNRQNHGFSLLFQAKVAFFSNNVCQSMLTHVLTPNKPNK